MDTLQNVAAALERIATETPNSARSTELSRLRALVQSMTRSTDALDPIRQPNSFFDPTNPDITGLMAAIALVAQTSHVFADLSRPFYGAGVYALYYLGDFPTYAPLTNTETPIYVGKADPEDPQAATAKAQGTKLCDRLKDHRRSIRHASTTLRLEDFRYRYLAMPSGWQAAAETRLITLFRPVWNNETGICYGFGKHGDATATRTNTRSPWDTLHPGRPWAADAAEGLSSAEISAAIGNHLAQNPPLRNRAAVIQRFMDALTHP